MKPLCGIPLKPGLRYLSIVDLIVSVLLLAGSITGLFYYEVYTKETVDFLNNPPACFDYFINFRNMRVLTMRSVLGFCIFYYSQKVLLAILMFISTVNESKFLIRLFVLYTLALICLHALVYFTLLCFCMMEVWSIVIYTAGFVFQEWHIWSASKYLDELVLGHADDQEDDFYDLSSRRSSAVDEKYSYKF